MDENDQNILNELVVESKEHLAQIEPDLLKMEEGNEVSQEAINGIFRAIHSIKGGFSFFGMNSIKNLSHVMENLMMKVRDGELAINSDIVDSLLGGLDKLNVMLDDINNSDNIDCSEEEKRITALLDGNAEVVDSSQSESSSVSADEITITNLSVPREKLLELAQHGKHVYVLTILGGEDLKDKNRTPSEFFKEIESYGELLDSNMDTSDITGLDDCQENDITYFVTYASILEPDMLIPTIDMDASRVKVFSKEEIKKQFKTTKKIQKPQKSKSKQEVSKPKEVAAHKTPDASETIRVRVDLLNSLVNLAGELVLSRNQLMQQIKDIETPGIKAITQNLDMVTSQLQENIMNTRMQPIGNIFNKFPRVIRDIAKKMNKKMELSLYGENVELDKSIIESLNDPLTHLVRNSADHGIEMPEERLKAGKPEVGKVKLRAFHEGGQVNIEIVDDGGGIDVEAVKRKAVENGIYSQEDADKLSDREAYMLLFEPGFSTAKKVTEVSGRGVGMDVVRTNIENLGGAIEINSERGKGSTVTLRLPLTLAIIPSLIVSVGERRLAIPQVSLVELVRLRAGDVSKRVEKVQGNEVFRLRDKLLPLVRLDKILGIPPVFEHPATGEVAFDNRKQLADRRELVEEGSETSAERRAENRDRRSSYGSAINIIVLRVGPNSFGLVVDKLLDNEEIVVKPLSSYLKDSKIYSGATIMGDGKVAMILDAVGISEEAKLRFEDLSIEASKQANIGKEKSNANVKNLLLFRNSESETFSVDLSLMARIEKVSVNDIEQVGSKEFVKYSNSSMRIIRPHNYMSIQSPIDSKDVVYVLVPKHKEIPMGIVVSDVLDVVESSATIDKENINGIGIEGSMIINDELVIQMDIESLFAAVSD